METDSTEKVDTQHGSCYSHLLALESAMLTCSFDRSYTSNLLTFLRFSRTQPNHAIDINVETLAGCIVKLQQSQKHFTHILEVKSFVALL